MNASVFFLPVVRSCATRPRILIIGEFSGRVRDAFTKIDCDATSCDFRATETPGQHYQGDYRDIIDDSWDGIIAHPPCTRLANSGVRWLAERSLWREMRDAALFFREILELPFERIAVENPIMHKYAIEIIGVKYSQIIQPWQFGHGETKATCLWLKGWPLLVSSNIVEGREGRVWKESPGADRDMRRSRTYEGIARAMAEQWGKPLVAAFRGGA